MTLSSVSAAAGTEDFRLGFSLRPSLSGHEGSFAFTNARTFVRPLRSSNRPLFAFVSVASVALRHGLRVLTSQNLWLMGKDHGSAGVLKRQDRFQIVLGLDLEYFVATIREACELRRLRHIYTKSVND